ncbi:hypothetical protein CALVIDRAFT_542389 [Calocera viscosa TUFC12733]|uniref:Uncharacterized protein n=1 Tax=Calocera viscosa (strain TUFC12733) TaxID=1330018 RepID=A0A167GNG5_CALVF|nr:hypothetical protein CALVIDRAFT_542389 [Calocera viscosa TUFC12733]
MKLWKQLFLRDHSHKHLRSVSTQGTGRRRAHDPFRPLAPLPHRPPRPPAEREEGPLDWRWMYRLSQNWATGFCTLSSLPVPLPPAAAPPAPHPQQTESKTLPFAPSRLQLLGPYILLASPTSSILHVLLPPSRSTPLTLLGSLPLFTGADATGPATCLAPCTLPTTSSKNTSFAAFSPRGSIVLHTLPLPPRAELAPRRTHAYTPPGGVGRQIRAAALHGELLVTLNSNFTLHLFHVPPPPPPSPSPAAAESAQLTLMQTLYSFTPFPPASLSLSFPPRPSPSDPRPAAQKAKLTLHHLLPAYPAHWVPSAHQFHITLPASSSTSASQQKSTYEITRTQSWSVAGFLPSTLAAESSENDSPPGTGVGGKGKGRVRKLAHVGAVGGDSRTSLVVGDGALHVRFLSLS